MKYCADTWFVLALFHGETKAKDILLECRQGKTHVILPIIVYAESIKKLQQQGVSQRLINEFFECVEASSHVHLVQIDRDIAREAASISLTFKVPLIDSFVAATTRLLGCSALLSGDSDYSLLVKKHYIKIQSW